MKTFFCLALLLFARSMSAQSTNHVGLQTGTYVIWTVLGTNSVELGTFVTVGGTERWRIMQDQYITNTVGVLEYENRTHSVLLKSVKGPIIAGERREKKEAMAPPLPK